MFRWLRRSRDKEIDSELQYHLDMLSRDGREEGMPPAEAETAARRKFGNAVLVRESVHDIWGWPALEAGAKDLRYAVRVLRKNPLFTLAAVLSLALGIRMTTSIYTLVNSILLHSLPYADPDRLVMLWSENKEQGWDHEKMSFPEMLDWEKVSHWGWLRLRLSCACSRVSCLASGRSTRPPMRQSPDCYSRRQHWLHCSRTSAPQDLIRPPPCATNSVAVSPFK